MLTASMLDSADILLKLIKNSIDYQLISRDKRLQVFLEELSQKVGSMNFSYSKAALRALYLSLYIDPDCFLLPHSLGIDLDFNWLPSEPSDDERLISEFAVDSNLKLAFYSASNKDEYQHIMRVSLKIILEQIIDNELSYILSDNTKLKDEIQKLIEELSPWHFERKVIDTEVQEQMKTWWHVNGERWTEKLRRVIVNYRNIEFSWHFENEQKQLLKQYYDANQLLVDCLNSDCYISREVRQEIEDTLLLPIAEIEKWKQQRNSQNELVEE